MKKSCLPLIIVALLVIVVIVGYAVWTLSGVGELSIMDSGNDKPDNAVEISIVYAPESEQYLPEAIDNFNQSFKDGINPVTGQAMAEDERPIWVEGRPGSSGTVHQGIINAIIAPNNQNVEQPTIFLSFGESLACPGQLPDGTATLRSCRKPSYRDGPGCDGHLGKPAQGHSREKWGRARGMGGPPAGHEFPKRLGRLRRRGRQDDCVLWTHRSLYQFNGPLDADCRVLCQYAVQRRRRCRSSPTDGTRAQSRDVQEGVRRIESLVKHYSPAHNRVQGVHCPGTGLSRFCGVGGK